MEFDDASYDQLQLYIQSGKKGTLPDRLVEYLKVIELIRSLYDKYTSKKFILRLLSLPPYNVSEFRAQRLYNDALNFFYSDNGIKREAWGNIYAEKLDKLALLHVENDDFEGARRCMLDAAKLRIGDERKQEIPRALLDRRPIFYTIKPKELGFPEVNRRRLAEWIDKLPDVPDIERMRLHRDGLTENSKGNVLDVDIEDIEFLSPDEADNER